MEWPGRPGGAIRQRWGKAERAAYLLQHSPRRLVAAGRGEAACAEFIWGERRWRRCRRVGEKSYALCARTACQTCQPIQRFHTS